MRLIEPQISVYLDKTNKDPQVKQISKMPHSLYAVACCKTFKKNMKLKLLFLTLIILSFSCEKKDLETEMPEITSLNDISVQILNPSNFENTIPGDELNFKGIIIDDNFSDLTNLRAKWISDKDGIIFEQNIDEDGETSFTNSTLSKNIHNIRLDIINEVDSIISDSIDIYNAIKLLPIEKTNNSSTISWSSINDPYFESFKLYRSRYRSNILYNDPVFITNNINDTTFIDKTAILGEEYFYKVILERTQQIPEIFESNIDSIQAGKFIKTDYPILKIIPDISRNYAYGIVNTESIYDDNETEYGLVFINLNDLSIENRILQNVKFSDLDIDPDGNFLYLSSRSNNIHKVNLNTKNLETTFSLSNSAHKIEVGYNGKLYYHITPPTSGSTQFRIYDLINNVNIPYSTNISAAYSSFSHGDFEIDQNNNLYHGESNSSGSNLSKIGTTDDTFSLEDQWNSNSYQSAKIILNNNKLYWNHFLLDLDFNIQGTFQNEYGNIDVQDVSPDGNNVLGWRNLFNSNDQSIIKEIPASFDGGIFVNDSRLLLYKNDNPISDQYESTIYLYDFN
ncbi:YncE family protein [Dokdonia sp. Hel_I_53]|uniref:YncE family protein n=1 Tax=Dokdonia sp. Hel_I_53 TaxID=1566287 RepID=UPI001199AE86|nr:hypothetical protein [Dokdonia sp. Hel_I_53]TVZ51686.1 hypothetical protein OD90_0834 [Dokdonia sp. Hel_I_53]